MLALARFSLTHPARQFHERRLSSMQEKAADLTDMMAAMEYACNTAADDELPRLFQVGWGGPLVVVVVVVVVHAS